MLLSTYIRHLQSFLEKEGDLECFYAADDEGNSYQSVGWAGTKMWTFDSDSYRPDMYCKEDVESEEYKQELKDGSLKAICVVN